MVPSQGHVPFYSETGDILCGVSLPVSIHWAPLHVKRCGFLEETASDIFLCRRGLPLSLDEPPSHVTDPHHTLCSGLDTHKLNAQTLKTSRRLFLDLFFEFPESCHTLCLPPLNTAVCPIFLQFHYISFVLSVLIFKLFPDIWTILHKYDNYIFFYFIKAT